jgi:hypothetical protein
MEAKRVLQGEGPEVMHQAPMVIDYRLFAICHCAHEHEADPATAYRLLPTAYRLV